MRRTTWGVFVAVAAVLAIAGCGVEPTTPADETVSGPTTPGPSAIAPETPEPTVSDELQQPPRRQRVQPTPVPTSQARPPAIGEVPRDLLAEVVADAASRARVRTGQVDVTRAEAVQWRDGSLGCPEPGMMYTQAIVDGYWVELRAGGEGYDYRLDGRGNFRICDQRFAGPPYSVDR